MKVKELITELQKQDQEQDIFIFKNGEAPWFIESVGTILNLPDVLIMSGQQSPDFTQKLISALNLKFEDKEQ